MHQHVSLPGVVGCEGTAAVLLDAQVRPLTCVYPLVRPQVVADGEGLAAAILLTLERFLPRVCAYVLPEV